MNLEKLGKVLTFIIIVPFVLALSLVAINVGMSTFDRVGLRTLNGALNYLEGEGYWVLAGGLHEVPGDLNPSANNTYDLGSTTKQWAETYTDTLYANTVNASTGRTATFVVAASDTSASSIAQADYVCDSIADEVEIQAAIDALPADGGLVLLSGGIFNLNVPVSLPVGNATRGIVISGMGRSTRLQPMANMDGLFKPSNINENFEGELCNMEWYGRVGTVDASGYYGRVYRAYFHHLFVYNFTYNGIQLLVGTGGTDCDSWITDCIFDNNGTNGTATSGGIYVDGLSHLFVSRNWFAGNYNGYYSYNSSGLILTDNLFGTGQVGGTYAKFVGGGNTRIIGNTFNNDVALTMLDIDGEAASFIQDVIVSGNSFQTSASPNTNPLIDLGGHGNTYRVNISNNFLYLVVGHTADSILKTGDDVRVGKFENNILVVDGTATNGIINGVIHSSFKIHHNIGYITENSGTSSIDSGQTTKVVAHGLAAAPTIINIAFREQGTNDFGRWWVDTIGATNFTLNISADPGASNLDFAWEAKVR